MITSILWVLLGVVGLYFGSEWLVGGSSRIAIRFGVSPLVIGLTLVAFGTSAPELVVCLLAALRGSTAITLGNVVGSNIANIGLILGFAGLIRVMGVERRLIFIDIPLILFSGLVMWALAWNGILGLRAGVILLVIFTGFIIFCFKEPPKALTGEVPEGASTNILRDIIIVILGLLALTAGGQGLVTGAVNIAEMLGVPQLIIGLTLVAVGTSLPELATSLYAIIKGETDIGIGNIVGSNIFNTTFVMGTVAIIKPIPVEQMSLVWDIPVMLVFSLLLLPLLRWNWRLSHPKALFLLVLYIIYVVKVTVFG
ncbi:MAG: sodium:calcium antiporter [Gemmatimonadetes bacterium]|nr:MAG: sodium:calcium antiporter [Gemmatimonadota bacterium]